MPDSHSELYVHLVWATRERMPLLTGKVRDAVYSCVQQGCTKLKAELIALNGTEDHVHLLARLPATLAPSALAKQTKGASSHLVRQEFELAVFTWQQGYAASVCPWNVPQIKGYILRQQEHHAAGTTKERLETVPEE